VGFDIVVELDAVARYYLKSERGKKEQVWLKSTQEQEDFDRGIDALPEDKVRREVEQLSMERGNEIYRRLYKSPYSWAFEVLPASSLHLPQINEKVKPYLKKASWELAQFADLVKAYSSEAALAEFRDDGRAVRHQNLLVLNENRMYRIIDGSHRAVTLCLRGTTGFGCYIGS